MTEAKFGNRDLFPALVPDIFLNHSAVSPPSTLVAEALNLTLTSYQKFGVGAVMNWVEQRERLRIKLGSFINARSSEVAFVQNTTMGILNIANCFPWSPGDRIVLFDQEFPTNITPWQQAAEFRELQIQFASTQEVVNQGAEVLRPLFQAGVRMVALSLVQFQTGWRMPVQEIAAIAHEYGATVFVDGIQGVGVVPVDVQKMGIDAMAVGGHKWMMGMEGAGFLYVSEALAASLEARMVGWLSHEDPLSFLFEGSGHLKYDRPIRKTADMFEVGACNALGYAAMEASLDLLMALGVENIFAHVSEYLDRLQQGLETMGFETTRTPLAHSGILSLQMPNSETLKHYHVQLGERGISVSTPDGHLRFAPHWPNALDEVPRILSAMEDIQTSLKLVEV